MTSQPSTVDAIARYVAGLQVIQSEISPNWSYRRRSYGFYELPDVPTLADGMLADAEFRALELGTWLGTTDGRILADAVGQVIPPSYEPLFTLVVDALRLASQEQAREGRKKAGELALATLALGIVIAVLARSE